MPLFLLLAAAAAIGGGLLVGGLQGVGMLGAGVLVALPALYLAAVLLPVRLDVEVAALRLRWLGGERRYALVRGAVTRVPLRGNGAARLRPRFGAFGWGLGPARLRGDERIHVVRLAKVPSLILVPTDLGRLAIAPASEEQLLSALGAAARVQQRLDEVATHTRFVELPVPEAEAPQPAVESTVAAAEVRSGHVLTGIERQLLEERLAAERSAALAAAEAERRAQAEAAELAAAAVFASVQEAPAETPARQPIRLTRPGWLRMPAAPQVRLPVPRVPSVSAGTALALAVAALPTVLAGVVYLFATFTGQLDLPLAQLRPVLVALALCGPAALLAGLLARAWFPRLLGLVAVSALCGLILVGRALLG